MGLFYEFNLDDVIPKDHLLRRMKIFVTGALSDLHQQLRPFHSDIGRRPSIQAEARLEPSRKRRDRFSDF